MTWSEQGKFYDLELPMSGTDFIPVQLSWEILQFDSSFFKGKFMMYNIRNIFFVKGKRLDSQCTFIRDCSQRSQTTTSCSFCSCNLSICISERYHSRRISLDQSSIVTNFGKNQYTKEETNSGEAILEII